MSNRILFVDDEPMLLKGLERGLRGMRGEWDMQFVTGGQQALDAMAQTPFDVVITDMRMPTMDGAELLDLVRTRFSQTVRMVLSGQSDKEAILRAVRPTHQYLSKPCDLEDLKQKLKSALALRDVLDSPELKQKVSQMETVPSLPSLYRELHDELASPHASLQNAAEIVSRDPGMTAKLLQLVNSAFLGLPTARACPKQAVSILGLENLRSLVLSGSVFSPLPEASAEILKPLWRHSYATARFAEAIAQCEHTTEADGRICYSAGLLHEIGWIVLASNYADRFESLCSMLNKDFGCSDPERDIFGGTHQLVGAYLLGLWGLPDSIVEAVAGRCGSSGDRTVFSPTIAVHVAERWDREWHGSFPFTEDRPIAEDLLSRSGAQEQLPKWQRRCRELDDRGFQ
jgi:HD-like signal output (HDOD) protein/CheY-like chemotaxis protein